MTLQDYQKDIASALRKATHYREEADRLTKAMHASCEHNFTSWTSEYDFQWRKCITCGLCESD